MAANWSLGTQLKAPQPDHSLTFFGAKIAATFMQLNTKCAHRAEYVDWSIRSGANSALFAVPAIPSLMVARARADDDRRGAVAVERIPKCAFVVGVNIEDCQPAALTRAKSEGVCIREPLCESRAPRQADPLPAPDRRHLAVVTNADGKRGDPMGSVSWLPISEGHGDGTTITYAVLHSTVWAERALALVPTGIE